MCTRSRSRHKIAEHLRIEFHSQEDQFQEDPPEVSMADNRTMMQFLQAPTVGYEDTIVIPEIATTNFELKHVVAKVNSNSSTPAISSDVAELKDMVRALLLDKKNQSSALATSPTPAPVKAVESNCVTCGDKKNQSSAAATSPTPAPVKAVESNCVTCGGTHSYQNCPATSGNVYQDNINDAPMPNLKPSIPYPSRRDNKRRHEQANEQIEKFYEIFKDMSFEISFTDALILMPKFASTLKALIGNKEKLSEMGRTLMIEHCSAVILNKLPKKFGDPGKFLIPCEFPGMDECLALADLGASINLMPLSVWKELSLPELTITCMTLELADLLDCSNCEVFRALSFVLHSQELHILSFILGIPIS
nr:reverse transcriptase domain-containing protein [Tanacetum cinerariifolium]